MLPLALVIESIARLALVVALLFFWLPARLFEPHGDHGWDRAAAGAIRMACLLIFGGYLLIVTRLYELLSLLALFLAVAGWRFYRRSGPLGLERWRDRLERQMLLWLESLEARRLQIGLLPWARAQVTRLWGAYRPATVGSLALLGLAGVAAYLRFYDPVSHAAPAFSDAYVTLSWMKYAEERRLFADGLYPQGFHIVLSALRKLTTLPALLTLKFTGPLVSLFTVVTVMHFLLRITGREGPAIIGAAIYGTLRGWLPYTFDRQAATDAQEFAMAFLLPALWFAHRYLRGGRAGDLMTALCATAVILASHFGVSAFLAAGFAAVLLASLLQLGAPWRRALTLIGAGCAGGAVGLAPIALGYLLGRPVFGDTLAFIASPPTSGPPPFDLLAYTALTAAALGVAAAPWAREPDAAAGRRLVALLAAVALALYHAQRFGISSRALAARSGEFWSLAAAVAIPMAWVAVAEAVERISHRRLAPVWEVACALAIVAALWAAWPPRPATPYRMQSDEAILQYVRILREFAPTDWLLVSGPEGYALALSEGWHMHIADFVARFPPDQPLLLGGPGELDVENVFLFLEHPPLVAKIPEAQAQLPERERWTAGLQRWIERYGESFPNLSHWYSGPYVDVYRISRARSPEVEFRRLWGVPPPGGR